MAKTALTDEQKAARKAEAAAAKAANFKRLANARVNKALDAISGIGGLANTNTYTYDQAQVDAILIALQNEVVALQNRFKPNSAVAAKGFNIEAAVEAVTETSAVEAVTETSAQ